MLGTGLTGTFLGMTIGNLGFIWSGNLMSKRLGIFFTVLTLWLPGASFTVSPGQDVVALLLVVGGGALSSGVEPLVMWLTGVEPVLEEVGAAGGGLERSGRVKVPAGWSRGVEPLVLEAGVEPGCSSTFFFFSSMASSFCLSYSFFLSSYSCAFLALNFLM